jgi:hypothetical protein
MNCASWYGRRGFAMLMAWKPPECQVVKAILGREGRIVRRVRRARTRLPLRAVGCEVLRQPVLGLDGRSRGIGDVDHAGPPHGHPWPRAVAVPSTSSDT